MELEKLSQLGHIAGIKSCLDSKNNPKHFQRRSDTTLEDMKKKILQEINNLPDRCLDK
jgi:hypothetical protein